MKCNNQQPEDFDLPKGWQETRLGEVCQLRAGSVFKPQYQGKTAGDYPFVKVSDMNLPGNEICMRHANNWIDENERKELRANLHPVGATVFAKIGIALTYNRRRQLVRETIIDNNMMSAIPNEVHVDAKYLYYLLCLQDFNLISEGSALPFLSVNALEKISFPVPPLTEQRAIAKILGDLDEKIELNHQMNKTLESIAQAIFKQWFVDESDNEELIPAKDYIEFDPRISVKKGEILPYVDMGELSTEGMTVGNIVSKPFAGGSRFENGDTLLARITPCLENGKTAFVNFLDNDKPVGFGSTEFIVMRAKKGMSCYFVYCLARDPAFRSFAIQSMVGSSGRQRVQRNMLETYELQKPEQKLLDKFHGTTAALFMTINENRKQIKILSQIRDSLLPKLMSGEIRVDHAEAAS